MELFTILTTIGGVCGSVVTIIGFFTLILKKPKSWIKKIAVDVHKEQMKEVTILLKKIENNLEGQQKADICSLRHSITDIYEKNKDSKTLPINIKQDLCNLYESYTELGGNSYVHQIYEDMMEWDAN